MKSTLDENGVQSALQPAGLGAELTLGLTNAMLLAALVIFAVVMACLWLAWRRPVTGRNWWIVVGGVAFPLVVLGALVIGSAVVLRAASGPSGDATVTVEVTGYQYWWDVVHDPNGRALRDANEIWVPVGQKVRIVLKSDDVIHSFWVPKVAGKMDMIPGRVNEMTLVANEAGRFRGQCAEFCGLSHPLMAFEMVAVPPDEYQAYLDRLDRPVAPSEDPLAEGGREVFLAEGCGACHAVRGVSEGTGAGPDLSRLGARASLGAGMWRTNVGNIAGWVADVQDMKPGAKMPSYNLLEGPRLRALSHWLKGLGT
jgi:cytochrome c oxidase subunit 2